MVEGWVFVLADSGHELLLLETEYMVHVRQYCLPGVVVVVRFYIGEHGLKLRPRRTTCLYIVFLCYRRWFRTQKLCGEQGDGLWLSFPIPFIPRP